MAWLKGLNTNFRIKPWRHGIDFSVAEALQHTTEGTVLKFRGGTTMGYDHATRGGIRIVSTRDNEYAHGLAIEDTITCAKETRKGALYMYSERASAQTTSSWGGGEDQLVNLTLRNYSDSSSSGLGMRGIDLNLRQRSGAKCTNMYGVMSTIENDSGCTISGNIYAGRFVLKNNGTQSGGTHHTLQAVDESQGTFTGASLATLLYLEKHANSYGDTHDAAIYMINNSATSAKDITYGVYLKSGASGAQFTYFAGFDSNDGDEGFTAGTGLTQGGNIDGYIKVYDAETGQALYVNCYDAAPA